MNWALFTALWVVGRAYAEPTQYSLESVLIVAPFIPEHLIPLIRLAKEMSASGHAVTLLAHDCPLVTAVASEGAVKVRRRNFSTYDVAMQGCRWAGVLLLSEARWSPLGCPLPQARFESRWRRLLKSVQYT